MNTRLPPSHSEPTNSPCAPSALPDPLRAVIVDDHELVRQCLRVLIERGNGEREARRELKRARNWCVVGEAATDEEALDVVGRERPHVVLLDVHLGESDGLALLPALLRLCPCQAIVLSGWVDDELRERALSSGAREVLPKACPPELLFKSIQHLDLKAGHA